MKIDIIKIGNSQGVRIPKTIMEQCGFGESVEMEIKDGNLSV
ncbi:MAG: AbrB/MazE/SpoVT family DNA-binding domain-containing protein [Pleurocapsa sp.]